MAQIAIESNIFLQYGFFSLQKRATLDATLFSQKKPFFEKILEWIAGLSGTNLAFYP